MEGSQITRGRGRPRKTIIETVKKDLVINRTLWGRLILVAKPT
jgi:hypothetical protein